MLSRVIDLVRWPSLTVACLALTSCAHHPGSNGYRAQDGTGPMWRAPMAAANPPAARPDPLLGPAASQPAADDWSRPASAPWQPAPSVPAVAVRPPTSPPSTFQPPAPPPAASPSPAPAPVQPSPAPAPAAVDPTVKVHELYRAAAASYASIDGYVARLRRRETVNGKEMPEELMFMKFRKQPWSVYFKWIGSEATGREVTFVKGRYDNKMHISMGPGEKIPFVPRQMALAPDSPMAKARSRHEITEGGIGNIIDRVGRALNGPQAHLLRYVGPVSRPEYAQPLEGVEQTILPGEEPHLPRGGRRILGFDPASRLPVLVMTYDERRQLVELYVYDSLQYPVSLTDADFNPDNLGKSK